MPNPTPVALITGAAGGIGGAAVARFVAGGWRVATVDINQSSRPLTADDVLPIVADLRRVDDCRRAVAEAAQWGGRLDAVVNAAGVWTGGSQRATTEDEWDPRRRHQSQGSVLRVLGGHPPPRGYERLHRQLSSDAGLQGNAGAAVYCASKGGVSIVTKALALELAPLGMRQRGLSRRCRLAHAARASRGQQRSERVSPEAAARLSAGSVGADSSTQTRSPSSSGSWRSLSAAAITGANVSIDFGLSAGIT